MINLTFKDRPEYNRANWLIDNYNQLGIPFDRDGLKQRLQTVDTEADRLEAQIYQEAGKRFNLNSSAQFANLLVREFGVDEKLVTIRSGALSVNQDNIPKIQARYNLKIVEMVSRWKSLRLQHNNIDGDKGILKYIRPTNMRTAEGHQIGVVIPKITLLETGRYQFSQPSIGNLSPEVMQFLCAPEGYSIVSIDTAQQEPTILFNGVLNSPYMKKLFLENSSDKYVAVTKFCLAQEAILEKLNEFLTLNPKPTVNDWVYSFIQKDPQTGAIRYYRKKPVLNYSYLNNYIMTHAIGDIQYSEEERQGYKTALLSGSYGAYITTLKSKAGDRIGASFYNMLNTLPEMVDYRDRASQYLKSGGRTVYTMFGTILKLKEYNSRGEERNHEELLRLMVNYPTQGTGADLLKFLICKFYDWTLEKQLSPNDCRIVTTRHDEVVIMIRNNLLHLLDEIKSLVEFQVEDWSPIYSKMSVGPTYTKA